MKKENAPLPPSGESREVMLDLVNEAIERKRKDPNTRDVIYEYDRLLAIKQRLEFGLPQYDPVDAAWKVLEERGTWVPLRELAEGLNSQGIMAKSTRKESKKGQPPERTKYRAWTNVERLEKAILGGVGHGHFRGYKIQRDRMTITYVGINSLAYPAGVEKLKLVKYPKKKLDK